MNMDQATGIVNAVMVGDFVETKDLIAIRDECKKDREFSCILASNCDCNLNNLLSIIERKIRLAKREADYF